MYKVYIYVRMYICIYARIPPSTVVPQGQGGWSALKRGTPIYDSDYQDRPRSTPSVGNLFISPDLGPWVLC